MPQQSRVSFRVGHLDELVLHGAVLHAVELRGQGGSTDYHVAHADLAAACSPDGDSRQSVLHHHAGERNPAVEETYSLG